LCNIFIRRAEKPTRAGNGVHSYTKRGAGLLLAARNELSLAAGVPCGLPIADVISIIRMKAIHP
jgi:hypothetical protein